MAECGEMAGLRRFGWAICRNKLMPGNGRLWICGWREGMRIMKLKMKWAGGKNDDAMAE